VFKSNLYIKIFFLLELSSSKNSTPHPILHLKHENILTISISLRTMSIKELFYLIIGN